MFTLVKHYCVTHQNMEVMWHPCESSSSRHTIRNRKGKCHTDNAVCVCVCHMSEECVYRSVYICSNNEHPVVAKRHFLWLQSPVSTSHTLTHFHQMCIICALCWMIIPCVCVSLTCDEASSGVSVSLFCGPPAGEHAHNQIKTSISYTSISSTEHHWYTHTHTHERLHEALQHEEDDINCQYLAFINYGHQLLSFSVGPTSVIGGTFILTAVKT